MKGKDFKDFVEFGKDVGKAFGFVALIFLGVMWIINNVKTSQNTIIGVLFSAIIAYLIYLQIQIYNLQR